ncbi:MAG: helix-turn-helix domain-containing protein [bacterium]
MATITIASVIVSSIAVDSYVLDTLLPDLVGHDRQPSAFLVYLYLWRHATGASEAEVQASLQEITSGTGVSKRAVQAALGLLTRRKLLSVARAGITAVPTYTVRRPWIRNGKQG